MGIQKLDEKILAWLGRAFIPTARLAIFLVYFWFGAIKLFGLSPASPLAEALAVKTVGVALFHPLFVALALLECLIGILFLLPAATRVVIPLLLLHLVIVCAPLLLLPALTWQHPFVPTLEGQYIIKNVLIVALAVGVAASAMPLASSRKK